MPWSHFHAESFNSNHLDCLQKFCSHARNMEQASEIVKIPSKEDMNQLFSPSIYYQKYSVALHLLGVRCSVRFSNTLELHLL